MGIWRGNERGPQEGVGEEGKGTAAVLGRDRRRSDSDQIRPCGSLLQLPRRQAGLPSLRFSLV